MVCLLLLARESKISLVSLVAVLVFIDSLTAGAQAFYKLKMDPVPQNCEKMRTRASQ